MRKPRLWLKEIRTGDKCASIRCIRRWLIESGRGDSLARAKLLLDDVRSGKCWAMSRTCLQGDYLI